MPLYDVSYQHYRGARLSRPARSWALARTGFDQLLKKRRFLLLLAVSWIPALVRGVQIYIARQLPQTPDWLEVGPALFKSFLAQQVSPSPFVLLVALFAGAGAISGDLRSGALVIYLSRPISRMDYFLGKILPVFGFLLGITLLPAIVLLLFAVSMADDWSLLTKNPWLPLSIFLYSLWAAGTFSATVLAVSSLSRSGRLAAAGFVLAALGSHFLYNVILRMMFRGAPAYLSLFASTVHVADVFFGGSSRYAGSPFVSLFTTALLVAGSIWLIDTRLRSTEVVA